MNIFYTDECPVQCATYLDDKRVVKMTLETAQILSTAVRVVAPDDLPSVDELYHKTHENHPCVVWARASQANYIWLLKHLGALLVEYSFRYPGKTHASTAIYHNLFQFIDIFQDVPFTTPPNCTRHKGLGIDFSTTEDVPLAYKQYLSARWESDKRTPTWYGEGR